MYVIIAIAVVVIAFVVMKPKVTTTPTTGFTTKLEYGDIPVGTTFDKRDVSGNAGNYWVTWKGQYVEIPGSIF
jgi:hypothetical protein